MSKTLIHEDDCICIFKPTSFQESEIIGKEICCFAFSQGRCAEHYIENHESIYYVYDVMRKGDFRGFCCNYSYTQRKCTRFRQRT